MKKIILLLSATTLLMHAEGAFSLGHKHFSFNISQDNDYTVVGAHVNYYMVDNLSVGAGVTAWLGDKPSITSFTLPVTYYMPLESSIRPYAGLFASYTLVSGGNYDNYSSFGGRAGLVLDVSPNSYTYAGWVQVKHNGDNNLIDSSEGYPEFGFGISF